MFPRTHETQSWRSHHSPKVVRNEPPRHRVSAPEVILHRRLQSVPAAGAAEHEVIHSLPPRERASEVECPANADAVNPARTAGGRTFATLDDVVELEF